jgi:sugar/nucleoside kinase (ribokinase family)
MRRSIDILSAGELYVEFTSADFAQAVEEGALYKRTPGGAPALVAVQMARLGNNAMLAATVGTDDMGKTLVSYLNQSGVDSSCVAQVDEPTTLILNTQTPSESNMQVYRAADSLLSIRQFPFQSFEQIGVFHATCFALSKNPSQHVILQAAERAQRAGCIVSLDLNYTHKIFPDRIEAKKMVSEFSRYKALIKLNAQDWSRLYEDQAPAPQAVIDHFLKIGAEEVCYITGNEFWVGNDHETHTLPVREPHPLDEHAFLAGYLTARLDDKNLSESAIAGRKMSEIKQLTSGKLDRALIYTELEA